MSGSTRTGIVSINIPHCAKCAPIRPLYTAALAGLIVLAPALMILFGDTHSKLINDNPLFLVLLPILLSVAGLLIVPRLPPFRRVGHVRRCVPAKISEQGVVFHNRAYAKLCSATFGGE